MIRKIKKNFEIFTIYNKYKNKLTNFIDNLNIKSLNMPNLINKRLYNITLNFKNKLIKIQYKFYNNFLDKSK